MKRYNSENQRAQTAFSRTGKKKKKISRAERYSTKQVSLGTLINRIVIHYEDFSFLLRGESAPFEVTVPFTPFSVPFLDLPFVTVGFFFTLGV